MFPPHAQSIMENVHSEDVNIRRPVPADGPRIWNLSQACPPLAMNSQAHCLLVGAHFGATSAIADDGRDIIGFAAGYRLPDYPDSIFFSQIAVAPHARKRGIGRRLLLDVLARPETADVKSLCAAITMYNMPAAALIESVARSLKTKVRQKIMFDRVRDYAGRHESEMLLELGPIRAGAAALQYAAENDDAIDDAIMDVSLSADELRQSDLRQSDLRQSKRLPIARRPPARVVRAQAAVRCRPARACSA